MHLAKTKEEFINDAIRIHNLKYDYSKVIYTRTKDHVVIICRKHGEFLCKPNNHLSGKGCKKCANEKMANERRPSLEAFICKANKVHNNRYDYSEIKEYKNARDKIAIICNKHGIFIQKANAHLMGKGCKKCANEKYQKKERCLLRVSLKDQKLFIIANLIILI